MKSLIRFFYSQHLFGNLFTAILIIIGIYSTLTIRKDVFPKVEFDVTLVTAVLPGASPEQIEKLLVNPIEQSLREVDGIKKVTSSATDSRAVVSIQLDPDARNTTKTNTDIQRAIDRIENYPEEADKPVVTPLESGQSPVIELTVTSDEISDLELRDTAKYISDQLAFVPGVAKITKAGWQKKEIKIEVDEKKLVNFHISLANIIETIKMQNVQMPSGDMVLENGREVSVKTDGEFKSDEEVEKTVVRSNFEGNSVKIGDVATVKTSLEKPTILYRTNGKKSYSLIVIKKEKSDALELVKNVKLKVEELKPLISDKVTLSFVNDFTVYLKNRIGILSSNMITGISLVFIVLALFLPFRIAVVVAIGVPFSMLTAITLFKFFGFSLNLISLMGLIIVSGMLVDDAIVVIENIFRKIEDGVAFEDAIIDGTAEVVVPVTASILTTVAAFAPMMFMSGVFGKFVFEIPLMVILPLLISLFEAVLISPGHILTIVGRKKSLEMVKSVKSQEEKIHWYDKILPKYKALIRWTVNHNFKTLGMMLIVLIITGAVASKMKFILFPSDGIYSFFVRVDGEPGATLKEMEEIVKPIEAEIMKLPKTELSDIITQIGIQQNDPNDPLTKRAAHYLQVRVNLVPESDRTRTVNEIVEELRSKIKKPEKAVKLNFEIAKGGPPQGRPISINVYGEDFKTLREIANSIKEELTKTEGVVDIEDSEVIGKKELIINPEKEFMGRVGLTTQEVALTLRSAFAGVIASTQRSLDEEIDIRVQLRESKTSMKSQIDDIFVGTKKGDLIPLKKIAEQKEENSRLIIQHEKYKRIINVSAQVDIKKTTAVAATKELQKKLKDLTKKFPRYEIGFGGENEDTQESMASLARAFLFAFIFIFFILILTFGSFLQPILVLFALPLGFVGVVWALLLHNRPISFFALLGIIALAGVIVNNAIIYIDFFNERIRSGLKLNDALVEAAATRLRPIILTSLTTVLGLMPTAYGIGGKDGFVMSLALALGWGLALGSIFTVLVFPALLKTTERLRGNK